MSEITEFKLDPRDGTASFERANGSVESFNLSNTVVRNPSTGSLQTPDGKVVGGGEAIDIRRHGAREGQDIAAALTSAFIEAEERKGFVYVPPINGQWRLESAWAPRPGVFLKGAGFHRQSFGITGSVIRRFGTDAVMYDLPSFYPAGALPSAPVCTGMGVQGIYFDGNGRNAPVMNIQKVGNFRLLDCGVGGSGTASLVRLFNQVQDSWFERNHFEQANPANGAGVIDIDDSAGLETDHNQNLVFYGNFFEAYRGPAVRIWGKGTGPGNSLMDFVRNKLEGLNSNAPHFVVEDASQINFDYGFIAGRGTSGQTVAGMFSFKNSSKSSVRQARVSWMPEGATLTNLAQLEGCNTISLDFVPSFASVVDGLSGAGLVQNVGTFSTDVNVSSTYRGTKALLHAGASRLPVPQAVFQGIATRGDGSPTIEVLRDHPVQIFNTPLTANRTLTISTTAAKAGDRFRVVRTSASTGAFTLTVGASLQVLGPGQWCEVTFNGTAWELSAFGYLAKQTTAISASAFVANAGTAVNSASTFDGYTIGQVVNALRQAGLLT